MRVAYRRESDTTPDRLWEASRQVRLSDARRLGRLVRWRIPGLAPDLTFDEMFRAPPFIVLDEARTRAARWCPGSSGGSGRSAGTTRA